MIDIDFLIDHHLRMQNRSKNDEAREVYRQTVIALRELDEKDQALARIKQWSEAYPLDVFPEPDFKRVADALSAAGLSLDVVSASNMRHVITKVQAIAEGGDA